MAIEWLSGIGILGGLRSSTTTATSSEPGGLICLPTARIAHRTGPSCSLGTADAYELELIGWNGTTALEVVLNGPSQRVTDADLRAYRAQRMKSLPDESSRARFGERWRRIRSQLPSSYPAYDQLLDLRDGGLLVQVYPRPGAPREWHPSTGKGPGPTVCS